MQLVSSALRRLPAPTKTLLAKKRDNFSRLWREAKSHIAYVGYRTILFSHIVGNRQKIDYNQLTDLMPNSGPIQMPVEFSSATEVVSKFTIKNTRSIGLVEFAGFTPDDAVFDEKTEMWEVWTYAKQASFIARFAYEKFKHPSILELGCGPAHLFYFFRRLGIKDYVGIDGSPIFLSFNKFLHGHERHFLTLNLQEEIAIAESQKPCFFDVICSFEVLEHIAEDAVDNFIRTIRNHMHPNSVFIGTASLQPDFDVHVLVRGRQWWLERFEKNGLYPIHDEIRMTNEIGKRHPFNWVPDNSNVFALGLLKNKETL